MTEMTMLDRDRVREIFDLRGPFLVSSGTQS